MSIVPYSFEPQKKSNNNSSDDDEDQWEDVTSSSEEETTGNDKNDEAVSLNRVDLASTEWCKCGNRQTMPLAIECVCCTEIEEIKSKKLSDGITCITHHEGFEPVVLNRYVLWAAIVSLNDREGTCLPPEGNVPNNTYRYAAYRQFFWFVHNKLGRYVRRVAPSCAVSKIRTLFPDPAGNYRGFSGEDQVTEGIVSEVERAWEYLSE